MAPRLTHVSCGDCPIRFRAVCSRCDADELSLLDKIKTYQSFRAGEAIIWADEASEFVGSIVIGTATLSKTLEDGRRQMVGLLTPSDFIGRPGRQKAPFDVTAVSDTMICRFRRADFEEVMNDHPHISNRLLEMTMDELDAAREWMLVLGRKTAKEKIASFLATFARRQASLSDTALTSVKFALPVTREAMADYLGLTIETVSRQFTALKKDGVIKLDGLRGITVPSLDGLDAAAGESPI
ncbi:MAG: transcriptional regulator FnrL [Pikeienuella sp.]